MEVADEGDGETIPRWSEGGHRTRALDTPVMNQVVYGNRGGADWLKRTACPEANSSPLGSVYRYNSSVYQRVVGTAIRQLHVLDFQSNATCAADFLQRKPLGPIPKRSGAARPIDHDIEYTPTYPDNSR